jgi:hypothetical protein
MLNDLIFGPSQACGAFRLVPLLREKCVSTLRLGLVKGPGHTVDLNTTVYHSYIPHGMVVEWSNTGEPVAAIGTHLGKHAPGAPVKGTFHRMAKRVDANRVRFLPLHLAMEGLLAMHFAGPKVQWGDFSRKAMSQGFSPRIEHSVPGWALEGFDEALRIFEIHENQVGVMVFVADALASAFVVPHPADYRKLHDALLQDFYGELIWQYAVFYPELAPCKFPAEEEGIKTLADLRTAVKLMREEWSNFGKAASIGVLDVPVTAEPVYRMGPYKLERFLGSLNPHEENHIGERIVDAEGRVQYLKTFRLSANQARRAFLLKQLADHDWNVESIAKQNKLTAADILLQYEHAGYGWLFHQHVMDAARAHIRRSERRV